MSTVKEIKTDIGGSFELYVEDVKVGEISYKNTDSNQIIADHTVVGEEFGGKGYASKLMEILVDHARKNDLKIVGECSFVAAMFERKEEYADVKA